MTTSSMIEVAIDETVRSNARQIFAEMGMSESEAIESFYREIIHEGVVPAIYRIPNAETLEAMHELEQGGGYSAHSVTEMMRQLREDD